MSFPFSVGVIVCCVGCVTIIDDKEQGKRSFQSLQQQSSTIFSPSITFFPYLAHFLKDSESLFQ
jgi:hypothetical protein